MMLGDPAANDSLTVAELRSHAHYILAPSRDRGYKSLISPPLEDVGKVNIMIIRVPPSCNFPHILFAQLETQIIGCF